MTSYPLIFRARDLSMVRRSQLRDAVARRELVNHWRGIYVRPDAPLSGRRLAAFALRRPDAVFGLRTALDRHDLTDHHAQTVDAFIPRTSSPPRFTDIPHRVVRQREDYLRIGVEPLEVLGVATRITTAARTVVDAFRFPQRLPRPIAIAALREYLDTGLPMSALTLLARRFRVYRTLLPYLQALQ